jgi:DNA-binding NarL/FixJ family response regulator
MMSRFGSTVIRRSSGPRIIQECTELALKLDSTQPLLIPLSHDDGAQVAPRITVHLAISDPELEKAALSLLGRNARFSVVKGSIGYAAVSDVRLIDTAPHPDQTRELDELNPPKLLFIGAGKTSDALVEAARSGAWAFVSELEDVEVLESAICSIIESNGSPLLGQIASGDVSSEMLLSEFSTPSEVERISNEVPNPLTQSEIEILDLVARGEPSKNIGLIVGLGEQTIKNYVVKILEKTRTHNRAHAAALAAQRGWLSPLESM